MHTMQRLYVANAQMRCIVDKLQTQQSCFMILVLYKHSSTTLVSQHSQIQQ